MLTAILIAVAILLVFVAALAFEAHLGPELDADERPLTWEGDQA